MMRKVIAIVGPTASGKTALAKYLASVFGGELVNADSRQLYKGMELGTAKAVQSSKLKAQNSKLFLIDIVEPNQNVTVADYKKLAIEAINDIQCRKKLPILVGGSGLYIKSVVDNLQIPKIPVQEELRSELGGKSEKELQEILKSLDPKKAERIDKFNKRRLVRALEVILTTGESFSRQIKKGSKLFETLQIALDIPKEKLFQNIEMRAREMIENGLENEVRNLVKKYGWANVLLTSIGYKEWKGYFEGEKSKEAVTSEIIKDTKRLVKKQLTWFKAQKEIRWVKSEKEAEKLVKKFLEAR